jgi:SAM-dependent methyltransferase
MSESVRFDRAAAHYDTTRAISDEGMARTIELLASELLGRGRALEVGVGTGLLALPLHEAGVSLAGLDLTRAMMARLVEKAGGASPFPLIQGDATRMPFADDAFAGAYLRWVLHLIPNWRDALVEAVRVIEPGGVLLVCLGAYDEPSTEIRRKFTELTGVGTDPIGLTWGEHEVLDVHMGSLGARLRLLPPIPEEDEETLGEFLDAIEEGRWSCTWNASDEARRDAVREGPAVVAARVRVAREPHHADHRDQPLALAALELALHLHAAARRVEVEVMDAIEVDVVLREADAAVAELRAREHLALEPGGPGLVVADVDHRLGHAWPRAGAADRRSIATRL